MDMVSFFQFQLLKRHLVCCLSSIVWREGPANSCSPSWLQIVWGWEMHRMGVKSATKKYSVGKEGKGVSNAFSSTGAGVTQFLLSSQFRDRKGLVFLKILSDTTNLKKKKERKWGWGKYTGITVICLFPPWNGLGRRTQTHSGLSRGIWHMAVLKLGDHSLSTSTKFLPFVFFLKQHSVLDLLWKTNKNQIKSSPEIRLWWSLCQEPHYLWAVQISKTWNNTRYIDVNWTDQMAYYWSYATGEQMLYHQAMGMWSSLWKPHLLDRSQVDMLSFPFLIYTTSTGDRVRHFSDLPIFMYIMYEHGNFESKNEREKDTTLLNLNSHF